MARIAIIGIINPGKGNKATKEILNLNKLKIESYESLADCARAFKMAPGSLLSSKKMRIRRNIRLIGVDCTYGEAHEFIQLVKLAQKGYKMVEKRAKEF